MLKMAKVVPIFKGDDKMFVNNYRPVSVLPVLSKILERLMYNRLNTYMVQNCFLTDRQFGFKNQHSTSMAVLRLVDEITTEIDKGNITVGVFIDLSKAFDTIDHNILLDKLQLYGVRGIAYDWMCSYINNRKQYVSVDNSKSKETIITCGVPQGSILGPLLFTIYINDIVNVSNVLNMILFADDTNIFISGRNVADVCDILNSELCNLSRWFKLNKLSLNVKKTNCMIFRIKSKVLRNIPNVFIDGTILDKVDSCKFLGIIINSSLT